MKMGRRVTRHPRPGRTATPRSPSSAPCRRGSERFPSRDNLVLGITPVADKDVMPSEVQEPADLRGLRADLLGINSGRHFPPSKAMRLSCTPGKLPGRIDGGVLASRAFSFSAGLARRYTSVVLRSA